MHARFYSQNQGQLKLWRSIGRHPWIILLLIFGVYQFGSGLWIFAKAQIAQYLIGQAWQQTLLDQQPHRPWGWADTFPVAELIINNENWFVLAGANGRNLAFGPTHLSATSMPGELGNSVILGHRDTQFNNLKTLKKGDIIEVKNVKGTSHYQINNLRIAQASQISYWQLDSTDNSLQSTLTLITCYPFDSLMPNPTHRFVVTAIKI
jgi:sortase A